MKVFASILAADLLHLGQFIDKMITVDVDGIHLDLMDNHYVPNMAFGPAWIKQIKSHTDIPMHVHLMMTHIDAKKCYDLYECGASSLMIHPETWVDSHDAWVQVCQDIPIYAVANPAPDRVDLSSVAPYVKGLLLMTVKPGFAGQAFMPQVVSDIPQGFDEIWVDGGIGYDQLNQLTNKNIHGVVLGSSLNHDGVAQLVADFQAVS